MSVKWEELKNQHQWRREIQSLLQHNDKALCKAILKLYNFQTDEEKSCAETIDHNGFGFTSPDARIMSKIARNIISHGSLTVSELRIARRRMPKYWKQLMVLSKEKLKNKDLQCRMNLVMVQHRGNFAKKVIIKEYRGLFSTE